MAHLISFDIDGTLETGNGPGPITLEMVRRALEHGHIIGSCSDRTVMDQKNMWAEAGIEVSFTVNKHRLDVVKAQYTEVEVYYHIGDTNMDQHYALLSGFEFLQVQTMDPHPWMENEAGEVLWGPQGRGPLTVTEPIQTLTPRVAPSAEAAPPSAIEDDFATTG